MLRTIDTRGWKTAALVGLNLTAILGSAAAAGVLAALLLL
jgi:hypothetical protein